MPSPTTPLKCVAPVITSILIPKSKVQYSIRGPYGVDLEARMFGDCEGTTHPPPCTTMQPRGRSPSRTRSEAAAAAEATIAAPETVAKDAETSCATSHPLNHTCLMSHPAPACKSRWMAPEIPRPSQHGIPTRQLTSSARVSPAVLLSFWGGSLKRCESLSYYRLLSKSSYSALQVHVLAGRNTPYVIVMAGAEPPLTVVAMYAAVVVGDCGGHQTAEPPIQHLRHLPLHLRQ